MKNKWRQPPSRVTKLSPSPEREFNIELAGDII